VSVADAASRFLCVPSKDLTIDLHGKDVDVKFHNALSALP